jgi:hypothetical protein
VVRITLSHDASTRGRFATRRTPFSGARTTADFGPQPARPKPSAAPVVRNVRLSMKYSSELFGRLYDKMFSRE